MPKTKPVMERILTKVEFASNGCWLWHGAKTGGYGMLMTGSRTDGSRRARLVHRLTYRWLHGGIPEGLEVHHRCMTPACVNPFHLEAVTHEENMQMERLTPEARAHRVRDGRERLCRLGAEARRSM